MASSVNKPSDVIENIDLSISVQNVINRLSKKGKVNAKEIVEILENNSWKMTFLIPSLAKLKHRIKESFTYLLTNNGQKLWFDLKRSNTSYYVPNYTDDPGSCYRTIG